MSILTNSAISGLSPVEIAGLLVILCALKISFSIYKHDPNPSKLPVVGIPSGLFGRIRAIPAAFSRPDEMISEGYLRYHKTEKPTAFLAPWLLNKYIHVLPPQLIAEHKSASEHILSQGIAFQEENGDQAIGGVEVFDLPYHIPLIRQKLTANLAKMLDPMSEELELAFKEEWEQSWIGQRDADGWVNVAVFEEAMKIVSRTSNRVFGGKEVCRDKPFLKNAVNFAVGVILAGMGTQIFPRETHWLVEPIISFRNRQRIRYALKKLEPLINDRKAILEHNLREKNNQLEEPEDLLQFLINEAVKLGPPHDTPYQITSRYLVVNFAAIHTTSLTFSNSLANIAAYKDPLTGRSYWDLLREEIQSVDEESEEGPGIWNKRKLNKLVGLDSVIRETLRRNLSGVVGLVRKVMPKEGYTYSNGLHVNHGDLVGVPTLSIHYDDETSMVNNAMQKLVDFEGFRFSRPYQELSAGEAEQGDISAIGGVGKLAAVTTADKYLAFGHGKHACPGRFFGVSEVKLFLKYCLLNYEIQPTTRAPTQFVWANQAPPFNISIKMKPRSTPTAV